MRDDFELYQHLTGNELEQFIEQRIKSFKWFDAARMRAASEAYQRTKPGTAMRIDGKPGFVIEDAIFTGEHPAAGIKGTGCAQDSDSLLQHYRNALARKIQNLPVYNRDEEALRRIEIGLPDKALWDAFWERIYSES